MFTDAHRQVYRVETICAVLPIAPSTCYVREAWEADLERLAEVDVAYHEQLGESAKAA